LCIFDIYRVQKCYKGGDTNQGDTDMNTFLHIIKNTPIATILGGFLIGIAFVAIWTAAWVVLP
jgi:hypothetical protein